ncbi:hypothetical protein EVAR_29624_1 [Eumeta japonica]|uniref:Uncharacterized protein n=1 Tax=Eumeta variegata TaxID=151549 RepID=A0A4C1W939_EUMVA|nr:hypothetical protein EVAR_29624_1 [Eumeta japonica]
MLSQDTDVILATFVVAFRLVSESCSGLLLPLSSLHHSDRSAIKYTIPSQEAVIALETPPGLRVSTGGGDHLLSDGSPASLSSICDLRKSFSSSCSRKYCPPTISLRSKDYDVKPLTLMHSGAATATGTENSTSA